MTAPVGSMAKAQDLLRKTLADCPTFQTWCGAADAATAEARIFDEGIPHPHFGDSHSPDDLVARRPFAILYTEPEEGFVATALAADNGNYFAGSGRLRAELEQDVPTEIAHDKGEADRRFKNIVGQIIDELCERSGWSGFLAFHRVSFSGPGRVEPDERPGLGDGIGCELAFEWGVGTGP